MMMGPIDFPLGVALASFAIVYVTVVASIVMHLRAERHNRKGKG